MWAVNRSDILGVAMAMAVAALFSFPALAADIRVPTDHPTIQAAIDTAVAGDRVIVAHGVWSGEGNRDLDLRGKPITVAGAGGEGSCVLDAGGSEAEPHRAFDLSRNEGRDAVIRGFTIRGGHAAGDFSQDDGAGIRLRNSSPSIIDCVFFENGSGGAGGGIACLQGSNALIEACVFNENSGFDGGGAVGCEASSPVIKDNLMIWNGVYRSGGAIYCYQGSSPEILGNEIVQNSAELGGGIYCGMNSSPLIEGNVISGNSSVFQGGGILCHDGSSPQILNNLVRGNISTLGGGLDVSYGSNARIEGCTFSSNQGLLGGAIHVIESDLVITGCILWDNSADDGAAIALRYFYQPATAHIAYCDLQDGIHVEEGSSIEYGPGMINADPLFESGPEGSCYLSQTAAGQAVDSPCLDTGDPSIPLPAGTTRTDHWPDQDVADMGFHREPNWAPICDIDGSGRVDGTDLSIIARAWGATAGDGRYDERADFDSSRTVDGEDLAILASVFGQTV